MQWSIFPYVHSMRSNGDTKYFPNDFGRFRTIFGRFRIVFGRFWTVSDAFGSFSDGFGPFSNGFGRFRTVFGSFRIVFRRVPAVLDDSNPNLKKIKFQLATAGARPCRSVRPCRPPQPWPIEIWNFTKKSEKQNENGRKRTNENEKREKYFMRNLLRGVVTFLAK